MKAIVIPYTVFYIAATVFAAAGFVHAHGVGQSLEQAVGEYLVDVGYDALVIEAEDSVRFDMNILHNATKENIAFTYVWARISQDKTTVFAGAIQKASLGETGFTFTFPRPGEYELLVRFQNNDDKLAEATFSFTVAEASAAPVTETSEKEKTRGVAPFAVGGVLGGLVLGVLFWRFMNRAKK